MSMQIKFNDDYIETTTYSGTVDKKYNFIVEVFYNSHAKYYNIDAIEWEDEPKDKDKAEERVSTIVMKWHYGEPDFIQNNDPGDENE